MSEEDNDKAEILVADDSKVIRLSVSKMLDKDYIVHLAVDGKDAWAQLQQNKAISVVFTDMQMPEMSGMELLANIRNSEDDRIASMPVIMITGQSDSGEAKQEVFDQGATDFILKPFDSIDLLSRAKSYARLSRKVVELEKKTGYDKLTGLYSANSFEDQGTKALSFAKRHHLDISVAYLEIDDFQNIYLENGKKVAGQIIVSVAKKLSDVMRSEDVAARIGVSKFALMLPLTNQTKARIVVSRVREIINKLSFDTGESKIRVMLAAGVTTPPLSEMEIDFSELSKQAETSLAKAMKKSGEKISCFYEDEEKDDSKESIVSDADLKAAFSHFVDGNLSLIDDSIHTELLDKLEPLIDFLKEISNIDNN